MNSASSSNNESNPGSMKVFDSQGMTAGQSSGRWYRCRLGGCTGRVTTVTWPDGKRTKPCSKGMHQRSDGSWQVGLPKSDC